MCLAARFTPEWLFIQRVGRHAKGAFLALQSASLVNCHQKLVVPAEGAIHHRAHKTDHTWDFLGAVAYLHFRFFKEDVGNDVLQALSFLR